MLVFIDESGDTGRKVDAGSSRYFIVALVVFGDREEALTCDQRITRLRQELGLPASYEFKFSKMRREQRLAFYRAIAPYSFYYYGIIIRKDPARLIGAGLMESESFYRFACSLVLESAKPQLRDATVVIDGDGPQTYKRRLQTYLRRRMPSFIRNVKMQSSHGNNLIQLTDMVAGAIHRSMGSKADQSLYRPMIRAHEIRVQVWP